MLDSLREQLRGVLPRGEALRDIAGRLKSLADTLPAESALLDQLRRNVAAGTQTKFKNMPPGTRRSYRVTADALGRWAYHCHLLYHMNGMFREVRVDV